MPALAKAEPFSAVLRMSNVTVSKEALERALGVKLSRFQLQRSGKLHYAQFDFSECDDAWKSIIDFFNHRRSAIVELLREAAIGPSCIDIAFAFARDKYALSVEIPSDVAAAIGYSEVDIEVSIYPTSDETAEAIARLPHGGR